MWEFLPLIGCFSETPTDEVKKDLTITIPRSVGKKEFEPEVIKCYKIFKTKIIVPRFYPESYKKTERKFIHIQHDLPVKLNPGNQEVVFAAAVDQIETLGGCTLVLGAGRGKSYITAEIIKHFGLRTLVVCHNKDIVFYWINEVFGGKASQYGGGKKIVTALTVGTIHTVSKEKKSWMSNFDFVVFDEVTEMISDKRRDFLWHAPSFILGLTATPDLKGEKRKIFEWFCGPALVAAELPQYNNDEVKWKGSVKAIYYSGPEEFTKPILSAIGYVSAVEMAKQFCRDTKRTEAVLAEIQELVKQGKNVFVFTTLCDYAKHLFDNFNHPFKALLMGRERTAEIKEIAEKHQVVFTTVRYASKGLSIVKMNAIVITQPFKSDVEQTLYRIMRIGGNVEEERIVVDFVDVKTSLRSQYYERKKIYKKIGFTVEKTYYC